MRSNIRAYVTHVKYLFASTLRAVMLWWHKRNILANLRAGCEVYRLYWKCLMMSTQRNRRRPLVDKAQGKGDCMKYADPELMASARVDKIAIRQCYRSCCNGKFDDQRRSLLRSWCVCRIYDYILACKESEHLYTLLATSLSEWLAKIDLLAEFPTVDDEFPIAHSGVQDLILKKQKGV